MSARTPRRRSPLSLRFGSGSRHNTRQLRLSTQRLSNTARAWRTSVKVRSSPPYIYGSFAPADLRDPYISEREIEQKTLAAHAARASSELRACERALSCIIEGVGPDQLLIRYSINGGEGSSTRDVSFVLDVSSPSYKGASNYLCVPDAWPNNR